MEHPKIACPERRALDLVSDRWTPLVVKTLLDGPMRYNDLRRAIPDVSQRMLTRSLRRLEAEGLVHREAEPTIPPKVIYSLTATGQSMRTPLDAIAEWGVTAFT